MEDHEIRSRLRMLAQDGAKSAVATRMYYNRVDDLMFRTGDMLHHLAMLVQHVQPLDADRVLPTFFAPEACDLLKSLPNLYWFWTVVEVAADGINKGPITLEEVQEAFSALRVLGCVLAGGSKGCNQSSAELMCTQERIYDAPKVGIMDPNQPLDELTREQQLLRLAIGVMVLDLPDGCEQPKIVINPIFAPWSLT